MSWWDDEDDVLGDSPADRLKAVWRTLRARREGRGLGLPTTEEALGSFAAALRHAELDPPLSRVVMWRDGGRQRDFDGTTAVPELTEAFGAAMGPIAEDYRQQVDRLPRASELVKTLDFILCGGPQKYLADADEEEWETVSLRAE